MLRSEKPIPQPSHATLFPANVPHSSGLLASCPSHQAGSITSLLLSLLCSRVFVWPLWSHAVVCPVPGCYGLESELGVCEDQLGCPRQVPWLLPVERRHVCLICTSHREAQLSLKSKNCWWSPSRRVVTSVNRLFFAGTWDFSGSCVQTRVTAKGRSCCF